MHTHTHTWQRSTAGCKQAGEAARLQTAAHRHGDYHDNSAVPAGQQQRCGGKAGRAERRQRQWGRGHRLQKPAGWAAQPFVGTGLTWTMQTPVSCPVLTARASRTLAPPASLLLVLVLVRRGCWCCRGGVEVEAEGSGGAAARTTAFLCQVVTVKRAADLQGCRQAACRAQRRLTQLETRPVSTQRSAADMCAWLRAGWAGMCGMRRCWRRYSAA